MNLRTFILCLAASAPSAAFANDASNTSADDFDLRNGERIFREICQGCHMEDGRGAQGAGFYPALADNPKLMAAAYPVHVVSNGYGGMPPFANYLDEDQIASVVNYIRTNFGNAYADSVDELDVRRVSLR